MIEVTVLFLDETFSSTAIGPMEVFKHAGALWNYLTGAKADPRFHVTKQYVTEPGHNVKPVRSSRCGAWRPVVAPTMSARRLSAAARNAGGRQEQRSRRLITTRPCSGGASLPTCRASRQRPSSSGRPPDLEPGDQGPILLSIHAWQWPSLNRITAKSARAGMLAAAPAPARELRRPTVSLSAPHLIGISTSFPIVRG